MKNNIIKWMSFLSIILMIGTGCQDQTEAYKEFVVPGGNVYPGVVVNPMVLSGANRVQINGLTPMGGDVNEVRVFWNYFTDSVSYLLNENTPENLEIEIAGLKEQSYLFTLRSYNNDGDVSVPLELFGKSYGDKYVATLANRPISKLGYNNQVEIQFDFDVAFEGTLYSDIFYTNNYQEAVAIRVPEEQSKLIIADLNPAKPVQYITAYQPDTTCIDTFYCELSDSLDLGYPPITVEAFSSQYLDPDERFKAINVIDGITEKVDPIRFWATNKAIGYPHWITLDLAIVRPVSGIEIFRNPGDNRAMSKFTVEISNDNQNWISLGEFDFDIEKDGGQLYQLPQPISTRYVKITGTAPGGHPTFQILNEIVIL